MDIQSIKFPSVAELYSKDSKLNKDDVEAIEGWLKTQLHLPELTQFQIAVFLQSCYYELPAAQAKIENYFTFKTKSYLFNKVDQDLVRLVLATTFVAALPKKTFDNDLVILLKLIDTNAQRFNAVETARVLLAIMTVYFHQHGPADGVIVVLDSEGVSLGHLLKARISAIRQTMYFAQEAAPIRLKSVNFINTIPITKRFVSLARPFLKKETYTLVRCHYSLDTFYEVVPRECLPKELGGFLPSLHELQEENLRNIVDHWNVVQWHDTQRVDESQRMKNEKWLLKGIQKIFN